MGARYEHGQEIGDHHHGWWQLIYASDGAIHVVAGGQARLIPAASAALREPIQELVRIGHIDAANQAHFAVGEAMLVVLARAERMLLALTLPADRRAVRIAHAILDWPGSGQTLADIAATSGASLRTIQRIFRDETGMRLSTWRRLARLMAAVAVLLDGEIVTYASLEAGYACVSASITLSEARPGRLQRIFGWQRYVSASQSASRPPK